MEPMRKDWLFRIMAGGVSGGLIGLALLSSMTGSREIPPLAVALCAALGMSAGAATLPFAEDGKTLILRSVGHFAVTAALFAALAWEMGVKAVFLPVWVAVLAVMYLLIWFGRWIGWYAEVVQLRKMLGLEPGPSPLKWKETLPYLPFALIVCDVVPLLLNWMDRTFAVDFPVLSGLLLPYLLLPAVGFCPGFSLGKRQGICPLYPVGLFLCYLPMVFLLLNVSALFHCFMVAIPALVGNILGWLYRRAVPGEVGRAHEET